MPYHDLPHPKPHPHRTLENLTAPATVFITNGSIFNLALPCWYQEVHPPIRAHAHCKDWHDHVGVPSPHHPDHSCQPAWEFASWWTGMHDLDPLYPDFHGSPHHWRRHLRHLIDMHCLIPIHLIEEGYEKVYIAIKNKPEGLDAEAWIDKAHDHVIRIRFDAAVPEAESEPKDYHFSVIVEGHVQVSKEEPKRLVRDVAARGVIHIDPCVLAEFEEE